MRNGPDAEPDDVQWDIDSALHESIAVAAGNRSAADVIAGLHRRTCIFDHTQVPDRFLKGCEEHLEILEAIRLGNGEAAETAMRRHLTRARDAILARLHHFQNQTQVQP